MSSSDLHVYSTILSNFNVKGDIVKIEPIKKGHINKTFYVKTTENEYILQQINTYVFPNPEELMENVYSVTNHLRNKGVNTLTIVNAKNGKKYFEKDGVYRVYEFITDSFAYQKVENEKLFENAGLAFGKFQNALSDFNADKLYYTIKNFHNTPVRFLTFMNSVKADKKGRVKTCTEEIAFINSQFNNISKVVNGIIDGSIPLRVTHNDTKLNNVMFDSKTLLPKTVVDLDTVMPGSMLYDFGDAIRFGASTANEDEKDLNKVNFSLELFKAFAKGFCTAMKSTITKRERELLPYSAFLMTYECGMRFLTDYLDGDVYFGINYPEHNLVRAKTQIKLAKEMLERQSDMTLIIDEIFSNV